ncbi:hypothetical protein ACFL6B_04170 [Thermodesulfobacteriota bacterium]
MEDRNPKKNNAREYIIISLVVFLCHWLLLLNDGLYFDDIAFYDMLKTGDWETCYTLNSMYGNTLITYYIWIFRFVPNKIIAFKLTMFISILLSAILIYRICIKSDFIGPVESMFIAMLSAVYPAELMTFVFSAIPYHLNYLLFLLGSYLAMISTQIEGKQSVILRILTFGIFFLSYTTNSLLVFHFGFLLFYYLYTQKQLERKVLDRPYLFVFRHWELILVPFVFWGWKQTFTPTWGWALVYENGYNKVIFDVQNYIKLYTSLVKTIGGQFINIAFKPTMFVFGFITVGLLYAQFKLKWHKRLYSHKHFFSIVLVGIILLIAGSFAYVAVGKGFGDGTGIGWSGWDSRNQLLLGLPMALIIFASSCLFWGSRSRWNIIFLSTLIITFSIFRINLYLTWQAEAIKHHSTIYNLSNLEGAEDIHVFGIIDGYPIAGRNTMLWWSFALKQAFGDFTRFGFYEALVQGTDDAAKWYASKGVSGHWYTIQDLRRRITGFVLESLYPKQFFPKKKQATLIIDRDSPVANKTLVKEYYYHKYFNATKMNEFLSKVTRLTLDERFPPPQLPTF